LEKYVLLIYLDIDQTNPEQLIEILCLSFSFHSLQR
jgi:hypothetical protein